MREKTRGKRKEIGRKWVRRGCGEYIRRGNKIRACATLTFLPPLHQKSPTPVSVPAKQHNRGSAQVILSYSKTTVAYPVSVCIFS